MRVRYIPPLMKRDVVLGRVLLSCHLREGVSGEPIPAEKYFALSGLVLPSRESEGVAPRLEIVPFQGVPYFEII